MCNRVICEIDKLVCKTSFEILRASYGVFFLTIQLKKKKKSLEISRDNRSRSVRVLIDRDGSDDLKKKIKKIKNFTASSRQRYFETLKSVAVSTPREHSPSRASLRFVTKRGRRGAIRSRGVARRGQGGDRHSSGQITSLVKPTLASGVASTLTC